jgi:uncharacterized protein (TIGR02452 family)
MAKRSTRALIAQETLDILRTGGYLNASGQRVSLGDDLASARARSALYAPQQFKAVCRSRDQLLQDRSGHPPAEYEVVNETTLHAAQRFLATQPDARVLALNFASARHPGGGFLNGAQAQEESLARASGLYTCIVQFREMYDANEQFGSRLYTDHMIYSPDVPVFRSDDDVLLERHYLLSFVTAPAVNVGAHRGNDPDYLRQVESVMRARMEKVLSLAVAHGHEVLVLGAWGCGVFRNDPEQVAGWFHSHLAEDGLFHRAFRKVLFAVLDHTRDQSTIRPFERYFGTRPEEAGPGGA